MTVVSTHHVVAAPQIWGISINFAHIPNPFLITGSISKQILYQ